MVQAKQLSHERDHARDVSVLRAMGHVRAGLVTTDQHWEQVMGFWEGQCVIIGNM